jgi:hypothetical protein
MNLMRFAPAMIIFGVTNETKALIPAVCVAILATMLFLFGRQCLQSAGRPQK